MKTARIRIIKHEPVPGCGFLRDSLPARASERANPETDADQDR